MEHIIPTILTLDMDRLVAQMKRHATTGDYDGRNVNTAYFRRARQIDPITGTVLLFTRDVGHHMSGWFKNPDYERCFHLSLSFWDLVNQQPRPFEHALAALWVRAFYGDWTRYVWEEGPSPKGPVEVRHYRVFCDTAWQPIVPRGEVYTRDFTEKGWKSWSDLQLDIPHPSELD